jgi:hypothetical protein
MILPKSSILPLGDPAVGVPRNKTVTKFYLPGRIGVITALAVYLVLSACVTSPPSPKPATPVLPPPGLGKGYNHDPFPSTYKPYPGVPTLVRNVTVFDGEGGRLDHGAGKWLTPGIIDVHSHIGGSTLNVAAENDINEMTSPVTPGVWVEHSVWPNDPGFIRDLTNGGVTTLQVLPGSEIPRRALWAQNGLRRESEARLWVEGTAAFHPHGQYRAGP